MRIAAYCRVSTDSNEQMESMENQKNFFEDFAKKNNYELIKIYADQGISGKQMKNRTQFLKMLEEAYLDLFDMVVVKDISRFARNTVDFLNSIRGLKTLNIDVKFLSNNQTILGDSEFILTIFSAMAQEESANLSKRVKFGKKINAQKGRVPRLVYGYDRIDNFTLVPNEQEADIVKYIFDLYVNKGYGAGKIAEILSNEKIPTKLNAYNGWISKTIRRILTNPIYVGKHYNNKYETKDYLTGKQKQLPESQYILHERPEFRIITDDIFNRAREKMDSNRKLYQNEHVYRQGKESTRHIFSTLIKCEHCGYSFSRKSYIYKKTRTYWLCTGFNVRGSSFCDNNQCIEEDDLLLHLKNYFLNLIKNIEKFINNTTNEFNEQYHKKATSFDEPKVYKQIKKLEHEKDKYKNMYVNNIIEMEELKRTITNLDKRIADFKKSLLDNELLNKSKDSINNEAKEIYSQIKNILNMEAWTNIDLKRVLEQITVNKNGNVNIYLKGL